MERDCGSYYYVQGIPKGYHLDLIRKDKIIVSINETDGKFNASLNKCKLYCESNQLPTSFIIINIFGMGIDFQQAVDNHLSYLVSELEKYNEFNINLTIQH